MPAVGQAACQKVVLEVVGDLLVHDDRAQRHVPARQALGAGHDVGHDAVVLGSEPLAGAPEAAHHLVGDHQDAVLVEQRPQAGVVAVGRNQQAVAAGDAFEQHRGDGMRPLHLNDFLDVGNAAVFPGFGGAAHGRAVHVRVEHPHDARHPRPHRPAARVARRAHTAHRRAVIAAVAGNDLVASSKQLRHLDGVLVGLRAAQREEALGEAGHLGQLLAQRGPHVGGKARPGEAHGIDLILDRLQDLRMLVPDVDVDQLAGKIEPGVAVAVEEVAAFTADHVNRVERGLGAPRKQGVVAVVLDHLLAVWVCFRHGPPPVVAL